MATNETNVPDFLQAEDDTFPNLQEFIPSVKLINSIPAQALKGFKQIDITFTCLDICEEYIAVGSNIGIVYLYNRKKGTVDKLRNDDYTNPITSVKLLISLECLVAVGSKKGVVFAFKVPLDDNFKPERFKTEGLHNAPVTALEWTKNGIKFFSGDASGVVVCTEIDHLEHHSRSYVLMEENSEIAQLSYSNLFLLVSTLHRSLVYDFKQCKSYQVGQKPRKCQGKFGATFFESNGGESCIYASRPGQRIWKSDINGIISETIILRTNVPETDIDINFSLKDLQFGQLKAYSSKFLLTWSVDKIVLVDLDMKTVKTIYRSSNIVDVATAGGEIFISQGIRNLIRLATFPENDEDSDEKEKDSIQDIPSILKELHISDKKPSKPSTDQISLEPPKVFDWLKKKFSDSSAVQDENKSDFKTVRSATVNTVLPDVITLGPDCPEVKVLKESPISTPSESRSLEMINISNPNLDDEIVYKPKKKKRKKKGFSFSGFDTVDSSVSNCTSTHPSLTEADPVELVEINTVSEKKDEEQQQQPKTEEIAALLNQDNSIPLDIVTESVTTESVEQVEKEACADEDAIQEGSSSSDVIHEHESEQQQVDEPSSPFDIYSSINFNKPSTEIPTNVGTDSCEDEKVSSGTSNSSNNNGTSASDNTDSHGIEYPRYGVECVQYNAPGQLLSLSSSNYHVFCVDKQYSVFVSEFPVFGFKWIKIQQPAEQIAVSPSEHILWVLYKETLYASKRQNSNDSWKSIEWVPFARYVSYISVCDTCGWYISTNGDLFVNENLSVSKAYSYPEEVRCPSNVIQVACKSDAVWLRSSDGKVYCRVTNGLGSKKPKWEEIKLPAELSLSMIAFGSKNEVYLIDYDGTLWFRLGITSVNPHGVRSTLQVESSSYVYQSCGQVQKIVSKVIYNNPLQALICGQQLTIIASSESGILWCKSMDTVLHFYHKHIIGHSWDRVVPKGTVQKMKWSMISAGGYSDCQGTLWGVAITGELLCFTMEATNSIVIDVPFSNPLNCVQSTSESLWILSSEGDIYIRREISDRCPQGIWWQQLDTSQLYDVTLSHISCSSEAVWACNSEGNVYVRIGTLRPPTGISLAQAWIQVDASSNPPAMQKVYVGPKSHMVWAIDFRGAVYVRNNISLRLLVGDQWVLVPGPRAKQLCISQTGVWLLKYSGKIFRRFGITESNLSGDYWKQIPGYLSFLSVTDDDNLWGVQDYSLCCHNSYTLQYENHSRSKVKCEDVSDDDWEDLVLF